MDYCWPKCYFALYTWIEKVITTKIDINISVDETYLFHVHCINESVHDNECITSVYKARTSTKVFYILYICWWSMRFSMHDVICKIAVCVRQLRDTKAVISKSTVFQTIFSMTSCMCVLSIYIYNIFNLWALYHDVFPENH